MACPHSSVEMVDYIDVLVVKPALHSWGDPHLILTCYPLYILLDLIYCYFVEDFGGYIHKVCGL